MKYLIVKGMLGFGDRLQSLKMTVAYAIQYNLQIYVDWRDPMWSHGENDFYTYFNLVNMPILKSIDDIPADATCYPAFWKGRLNEQLTFEFICNNGDKHLNLDILKDPYDADVIVYSCMGQRRVYNDSTFFANVFRVIDDRILNKIQYHASQKPLSKSRGIHIRGTDRVKNFNRRLISIQSIVFGFTSYGGMHIKDIVVVSDDKEQLQIWKNYYPHSYVVSEHTLKHSTPQGTHNMSKGELQNTKDEMNVDLLVDFFVLASCERIMSTVKDSRFFQEAQRLHPHVNTILGKL
jgi:hypothetical protein